MANNSNQPKVGILMTTSWVGDKLRVTAHVTRNGQPQNEVLISFLRDNLSVPGASGKTDHQGNFTYDFSIPSDAKVVRVKANAAINGITFNEVIVGLPDSKSGVQKQNLPTLVVEDSVPADRPNTHRLSMAIFDGKGKMMKGLGQISTSRQVGVSTPFATLLKSVSTTAIAQSVLSQTGNMFEIEFTGERWETIDVEFNGSFEMDIFVAEWNRKIELNFNGPKTVKDYLVPLTRPLFLGFALYIFFVVVCIALFFGIKASFLFALAPAALCVVVMLIGRAFFNRNVVSADAKKVVQPNIAVIPVVTNNNTFATMLLLDVIMVMILAVVLYTQWGSPILTSESRTALTQEQLQREYKPGDTAQRIKNTGRNIGYKTDRELVKPEPERSWLPVTVSLGMFALLILLTAGYAPVAASDEVSGGVKSLFNKIGKSRTEGTSDDGFLNKLLSRFRPASVEVSPEGNAKVEVDGVAKDKTPAAKTASKGMGVLGAIVSALAVDFIIDSLIAAVRGLLGKKQKKEQNRYRYQTTD